MMYVDFSHGISSFLVDSYIGLEFGPDVPASRSEVTLVGKFRAPRLSRRIEDISTCASPRSLESEGRFNSSQIQVHESRESVAVCPQLFLETKASKPRLSDPIDSRRGRAVTDTVRSWLGSKPESVPMSMAIFQVDDHLRPNVEGIIWAALG